MKKSIIRKINDSLARKTLELEDEYDFAKLVKLFSRLREEEPEPVVKYRQFIRRNEWGHPASRKN